MKMIFVPLVIGGLAAGAFGLILSTEGKRMPEETRDSKAVSSMLPADAERTDGTETATFALG